jgi:type IV pilus assembly protein PilX
MNRYRSTGQRGAILLVALVLLLVLTLFAVTGVREATVESRITANKAHGLQLDNAAEAATREAEFRYFNPAALRDKFDPTAANCSEDNTLKTNGMNKPCLLPVKSNSDVVKNFVVDPLALSDKNKDTYLDSWSGLVWMPYRGRDAAKQTEAEYPAWWNTYLISGGPADETPINVEYGASGEGRGTFYYLANGKTSDTNGMTRGVQSTFANVYVGLNN